MPGGGTSDYAIDIFYEVLKNRKYECFIKEDTCIPFLMMDDVIRGTVEFIEKESNSLTQRVYNLSGIAVSPRMLVDEIQRQMKDVKVQVEYKPDGRQKIAES